MQLLMPGFIWSSSFPPSELHLLIPFSLPNSKGGVIPVSEMCALLIKMHEILENAMSKLGSYVSTFLILLPGSIVKFGLHSSHFFRVSRTWVLLVRFAFIAIYTGLWHGPATVFHGFVSVSSPYERWQSQTQD